MSPRLRGPVEATERPSRCCKASPYGEALLRSGGGLQAILALLVSWCRSACADSPQLAGVPALSSRLGAAPVGCGAAAGAAGAALPRVAALAWPRGGHGSERAPGALWVLPSWIALAFCREGHRIGLVRRTALMLPSLARARARSALVRAFAA